MNWVHVVCLETNGSDLNVGQDWCLDVFPELVCDRFSFRLLTYDERFTHTCLGDTFDEITIYCRANTECEDIALTQIVSNVVEDSFLTVNVAVRNENDVARHVLLTRDAHRSLNRRQQFSSSVSSLLIQQADRFCQVIFVCLQ